MYAALLPQYYVFWAVSLWSHLPDVLVTHAQVGPHHLTQSRLAELEPRVSLQLDLDCLNVLYVAVLLKELCHHALHDSGSLLLGVFSLFPRFDHMLTGPDFCAQAAN